MKSLKLFSLTIFAALACTQAQAMMQFLRRGNPVTKKVVSAQFKPQTMQKRFFMDLDRAFKSYFAFGALVATPFALAGGYAAYAYGLKSGHQDVAGQQKALHKAECDKQFQQCMNKFMVAQANENKDIFSSDKK